MTNEKKFPTDGKKALAMADDAFKRVYDTLMEGADRLGNQGYDDNACAIDSAVNIIRFQRDVIAKQLEVIEALKKSSADIIADDHEEAFDPVMWKYIPKKYQPVIEKLWRDTDGVWILLKNGYETKDGGERTIHETYFKDLLFQLRHNTTKVKNE